MEWSSVKDKVLIPALVAPVLAFAAGYVLLLSLFWIFNWASPGIVNRGFRLGQLASGTFVAFTHGANDAQKTMGVIALALYSYGAIHVFYIPWWVIVTSGVTIAAGTYVGGWRIMRTLGQRLYSMEPAAGFSAQSCAGATIYLATGLGYPLSTTQVISGAVMGAGATKRFSAVRWGVAGNIVVAWLFTMPAAGLMAAVCYVPIAAIF